MVFGLTLTAASGTTAFCLHLYQKDKLASILERELFETRRASAQLENLLDLVNVIALDKVPFSKDILFLAENPCSTAADQKIQTSKFFKRQFSDEGIQAFQWLESIAVQNACLQAPEWEKAHPGQPYLQILPAGPTLIVPYIGVLFKTPLGQMRLAAFSMDGFSSTAANTLFLLDSVGQILWASDGPDYAKEAMNDTLLDESTILKLINSQRGGNSSGVIDTPEASHDGLISYARLDQGWSLISLAYRPSELQPLEYAIEQALTLGAAFVFFCMLFGKNMASVITKPLAELKSSAERLGKGDFSYRFPISGDDEIYTVKAAFNSMTDRILNLLEVTRKKSELESELVLAQQVQKLLLPAQAIDAKNIQIFSAVKNATQCGGDWWGYLEVKREGMNPLFVLLVGDVAGHGTASALLTATARGGLSLLASWVDENPSVATDPMAILNHFNRAIFDSAKGTLGMTMFAAILDTQLGKIHCANAGHNLPYLIEPDASGKNFKIKPIGRPGVPLGYESTTEFKEMDSYNWAQGSQLFLYSDGLIDCYEGDANLFDRKNLVRSLKANAKAKGKDLLAKVLGDREKVAKDLPQADDITAIVCDAKVVAVSSGEVNA
jgi:sigma-B regulation protein RsbU (phosphoserine phosphatase)